jgi:hypothetical protein
MDLGGFTLHHRGEGVAAPKDNQGLYAVTDGLARSIFQPIPRPKDAELLAALSALGRRGGLNYLGLECYTRSV